MMNYMKAQIVLTFILIINVCFAQDETKNTLWSVHIGANASTIFDNGIYEKENIKYVPLLGFVAGAQFQYKFKPRLAFQMELNYERKGYQINYFNILLSNGDVVRTSLRRYAHYAVLPIMAKVYIVKKKSNLFVNAGFYSGYCVLHKWKFVPEYTFPNSSGTSDPVSQNFKVFDMGIIAGIGFSIPVSIKKELSFELRNNLGLLAVGKNYWHASSTSKNESLGLLVGYSF